MNRAKRGIKSRLKQLKTILFKDIKSEVRQINDLFSILLFGVISIFIFSSAYNFSTQFQNMPVEIFVIENWLIIFFTLIFIMSKLFVKEKESGTLGGLLTSPISANTIFFGKIIYCFLLLSVVEIIIFLLSFFLSSPSLDNFNFNNLILYIGLGILLPTIDLSICGCIVSAFSMYARNKSFGLPILLFPLILPIITPIISINLNLLEGAVFSELFYEIVFLIAHTTLMISILTLISHTLLYD